MTNSDGRVVPVRLVGEQHVLEDMGGHFLPSYLDWARCIRPEPWMGRAQPLHKIVDPFAARAAPAEARVGEDLLRTARGDAAP